MQSQSCLIPAKSHQVIASHRNVSCSCPPSAPSISSHGCQYCTIAQTAFLQHKLKRVLPACRNKATAAREAHAKFSTPLGDHVTLLNVWKRFQACPSSGRKPWCFENCISLRAMTQASAAHQQLLQQMLSQGCEASSCGDNMVLLQKALLQGLFSSAARHQGSGKS